MTAPVYRFTPPHHEAGFTLVEVLIALLISSIGLLGLAGMQALALASTQVSSVRSLVALQASSLAAAMHSNQAYWSAGRSTSGFSMSGNKHAHAGRVPAEPLFTPGTVSRRTSCA